MELIDKLDLEILAQYGTKLVAATGVLAFVVSAVTQVLKKVTWLETHVPTQVTVIAVSLAVCPASMLGLASYYGIPVEWYMVFAAVIAAFFVALIAMDGWERVDELAARLIRK